MQLESFTFPVVLEQLRQDNVIDDKQVTQLRVKYRSQNAGDINPLLFIAQQELDNAHVKGKKLTGEILAEWLARRYAMSYHRIDPLHVNVESVTQVMSKAFAERHQILAVEETEKHVIVATANPIDRSWEKNLTHVSKKHIKRVITSPIALRKFIQEFYNLSHSVKGANQTKMNEGNSGNFEQLVELGSLTGDIDANDQHIVRIVDWLLQYAFDQRASDIHLEPRREKGMVRFRIDGVLHHVYELPSHISGAVLSRFKIIGRMDLAEKRKPLDGRIKTKTPEGQEVELRLSTLPTAFGEKLVARIFDPTVLVKSFSELGLPKSEEYIWRHMIRQPTGIVLVTGPTGSGKTTTLYTSLKMLARSEVNVCTVEDPIEMIDPNLNQMQVHHDIGLDFAAGVKALLRQDPDIIMVGEIRDKETAEMAIQASLTGHLVISTLHTNDAPSAITRLIEIGVAPYLISATVLGVLAQRLVRVLCPDCKQHEILDVAQWRALTAPVNIPAPQHIYKPAGCDECRNTGFKGREGIYELMSMSPEIQSIIRPDVDLNQLKKKALGGGMQLLRVAGAYKVAQGTTTIEEILRVAPPGFSDY
jgi:general secretion pathway protein E